MRFNTTPAIGAVPITIYTDEPQTALRTTFIRKPFFYIHIHQDAYFEGPYPGLTPVALFQSSLFRSNTRKVSISLFSHPLPIVALAKSPDFPGRCPRNHFRQIVNKHPISRPARPVLHYKRYYLNLICQVFF